MKNKRMMAKNSQASGGAANKTLLFSGTVSLGLFEWQEKAEKEFGIDVCDMQVKFMAQPGDRVLYHLKNASTGLMIYLVAPERKGGLDEQRK